jgi:hypothetical protein
MLSTDQVDEYSACIYMYYMFSIAIIYEGKQDDKRTFLTVYKIIT